MKRFFALIALVALTAVQLSGCRTLSRCESSYIGCFDTFVTLTGYFYSREQADAEFAAVYADIEYCNKLFDIYNDYDGINNLKTLNDAGGGPVAVEPLLMELLVFSKEAYERTGGKVNIALGSVLALWHDARESDTPYLPDSAALTAAAAHTDINKLELDEPAGTARLLDPDMRLDVGAVAKGFAARYAAENAVSRGTASLLIDLGGNVCAVGKKPDGAWRIGVKNPVDGMPDITTAELSDGSMVTSGDYQRYFMLDGVRYCHIIDPETLYPATAFRSVTVICGDSAWADALSTALFIMDIDEGMALVHELGGEALYVVEDGGVTTTAGFGG